MAVSRDWMDDTCVGMDDTRDWADGGPRRNLPVRVSSVQTRESSVGSHVPSTRSRETASSVQLVVSGDSG
ncbi:hypothetical protein DMH03_38275 [Amycolatopsis sp. WAC 01376]|nr:hypothetical protein DMH03_38275 [Amycolatopsis sp. WAC 01376]